MGYLTNARLKRWRLRCNTGITPASSGPYMKGKVNHDPPQL
nr:MAG TPA: hypothetical protein [Caudoviricetes sp.]